MRAVPHHCQQAQFYGIGKALSTAMKSLHRHECTEVCTKELQIVPARLKFSKSTAPGLNLRGYMSATEK